MTNRNFVQKRVIICFLAFIVIFFACSCTRTGMVAGKGVDSTIQDDPGYRIHQETIIDSNSYQYNVNMEGSVSRENTLNLDNPVIPLYEANRSLKITNIGENLIENPIINVNGKHNWYNIDSILSQIISPEMTEKQKAFSIWEFVKNHFYNADPAEEYDEIHDPVKMFNIYGYGICDDAAKNLIVLWQAAGLKSRLVTLNGHVVSEVWYEGQYHVMDAFMEAFYLDYDNYNITSSEQLSNDDYPIKRTHHFGPFSTGNDIDNLVYASLYGADDFILNFDYQSQYEMYLSLRPDESFEWRWDNIGKYHDNNSQNKEKYPPPYFSNGKLTYTLDLNQDLYRKYLVKEKNIQTISGDGKKPQLHLENAEKDGHIVLHFQTPYVIVGGTIRGNFIRNNDKDVIKMYISPDNVNWQRLWMAADEKGDFDYAISLDDWVASLSSKAKYEYYLMVEFIGANSRSNVGANFLSFETDVQMSPASLPALELGINNIVYSDETDEPHQIMVSHEWVENSYNQPPNPPGNAITPLDVDVAHKSRIIFNWDEADDPDGDEIIRYHFFLSDHADMQYAFSPVFDRLVEKNIFELPFDGLLNNNTRYYWRVRSLDVNGIWSEWSDVWSFVFYGPGSPKNVQFSDAYTLNWEPDANGTTPVLYEVYGSNESGFVPSKVEYTAYTQLGSNAITKTFPQNFIASTSYNHMQVIMEHPENTNLNKYYYRIVAVDSRGVRSAPAYISSSDQWIFSKPVEIANVGTEYQYQPQVIYSIGSLQFHSDQLFFDDGSALEFSLITGPEWLSIDSQSGLISGIPENQHAPIEVVFEVRNKHNLEISQQSYKLTSVGN